MRHCKTFIIIFLIFFSFNIYANVIGMIYTKYFPSYSSDQRVTVGIQITNLKVYTINLSFLGGGESDSEGYFNINTNPLNPYAVYILLVSYENNDTRARDYASEILKEEILFYGFQAGSLGISLNVANDNKLIDAANILWHMTKIREYFSSLSSQLPRVAADLRAGGNISGEYKEPFDILEFGTRNGYEWARTAEVIYHEYTHHVIHEFYNSTFPGSIGSEAQAIDEGISDYFACSFTNSALVGESVGLNRTLYNSFVYNSSQDDHWNGQVIGGACWDLRTLVGSTIADQLVYEALKNQPRSFNSFANEVKRADHDLFGSCYQNEIAQAFSNHGIEVSVPPNPVIKFDSGWGETVVVSWTGDGELLSFILKKEYNFGSGWGSPIYINSTTSPYTDVNVIRDKFGDMNARYSVQAVDNLGYVSEYSNLISTIGQSTWKNSSSFQNDDELSFNMNENYPNPFNPSTTISFSIPTSSKVILKAYDILGREVTTLVDEIKSPGKHNVVFDGSTLASGVYLYSLRANEINIVKKMTLVK